MSTTRILVVGSLLIGAALSAHAAGDSTNTGRADQISSDEMARMREIRPGEYVVRTREGCGVILDEPHPSLNAAITGSWTRHTWEGVCSEGMTLGPGKLIVRNDKMETTSINEGWYFHGRQIGHGVSTSLFPGIYYGSKTEMFAWDGEAFARNVARPEPLEPRRDAPPPSVSYFAKDRAQRVYYFLLDRCGPSAQPCVVERKPPYPSVVDFAVGKTDLYCQGSCGSLWMEKAGPLIAAFDDFAREHGARVAALKQAVEPILVQRKREAAASEAEAKRKAVQAELHAEAEKQHLRDQAAQAEQQFRTSLQTMNPGQLFARADELSAQGDSARAREVLRALVRRFANHPLAATAARQMAGESGGSPGGGTGSSDNGAASGPSSNAPPKQGAFSKESSRYSSICMRNAAKAEQAISAAKATRYFGGAVDLDILDMVKRIAQPCMAYDSKAKWAYDDAEQARVNSQCQSSSCSRWREGETGAKTRQWFEIFSGEFNKMMANWDGYSRDLDPPGSSSPSEGAGANRSAAGRLSSQQCEALKQSVIATKIPSNAAITSSQETVMWMTSTTVQMIDAGCEGGTPQQRAAERQQYQQAYAAASQACNQVQAGGRQCIARNHFGPGAAPEAGIRSPYPNIPVGSVPKITRLP